MPDEPKLRNGIVGVILNFIERFTDRPWRALFLLVAGIIAAIGFAAYQEREALVRVLLHRLPAKAELRTASTAATLRGLFDSAPIDAASLWAVNLHDNTIEYLTGRRRDDTPWLITPRVMRLFTEQSMPEVTAKLLRSEPVCADPMESKSLLGKAMVEDGMHWACFVPEPPSTRELLIGYVLLGFKTRPSEATADAAIAAVLRQTDQIVTH